MTVGLFLALSAFAAPPSDVSITTVGASGTWSAAVEQGEMDLLLAERLRWTLSRGSIGVRALADARFTLDPFSADVLRWQQVRQLGVSLQMGVWTVELGRHPVRFGGPRLVDGLQATAQVGALQVGAWGGLAPDLFTTLPRLRFGGGPVVAVVGSRSQFGAVGEVLFDEAGALDRAAAVVNGRYTFDRLLDASGRLDAELGPDDRPHLADGQVLLVGRPVEGLRLDALYNAFSSYRYLQTERLDPELQRFFQRTLELGLDLGLIEETRDPRLNHLVGGAVRVQPPTDGMGPRVLLEARQRFHPNPMNRFTRLHPQVALTDIPVAGRLEVALDGNIIASDNAVRYDGGVIVVLEPGDDPAWILDGSARWVVDPAYDGLGWYADLFVDLVLPLDMAVVVGAAVMNEPYEGLPDLGISGFLRVTRYLRPPRKDAR